jgi:glycosyltransferase involved in cell wall biosynthesis
VSTQRDPAKDYDYTAIVCTRNRATRLTQSLTSIQAAMDAEPSLRGELLVVDNDSTDDSPQVLASFADSDPRVRVIHEPMPGIGRARQRASASARGNVLLWTDDDIVVPPEWVRSMLSPILQGEADAVAGPVAMAEDLWRPWMTPDLAARYYAHVPDPPVVQPGLIGANMAFTRELGDRIPFDPELGTTRYPGAEDVLVYVQALEAGFRIRGTTEAQVRHHFDPSRLNIARLERLAEGRGRCDAYFYHHWLHVEHGFTALRVAKHLAVWALSIARARGNRYDERVLAARRSIAYHREMRRLRNTPRRYPYRGVGLLSRDS